MEECLNSVDVFTKFKTKFSISERDNENAYLGNEMLKFRTVTDEVEQIWFIIQVEFIE